MENYSWTCPNCNRPVTITREDVVTTVLKLRKEDCADGCRIEESQFIICPNPDCKRLTFIVKLYNAYIFEGLLHQDELLNTWQLIPPSQAKQFPDYIPKAILDDYKEACLVKELSPKASATLARRCLQGIIRDFWCDKVKPGKLSHEINQIKGEVEETTWQAIDAVRSVGNIGAHMEEDVNLIIEIEPNEAELLIGLVEILLNDWYVARETKKKHLEAIIELGGKKRARKSKQKLANPND